jgi:hypothetical protein
MGEGGALEVSREYLAWQTGRGIVGVLERGGRKRERATDGGREGKGPGKRDSCCHVPYSVWIKYPLGEIGRWTTGKGGREAEGMVERLCMGLRYPLRWFSLQSTWGGRGRGLKGLLHMTTPHNTCTYSTKKSTSETHIPHMVVMSTP